MITNDRTGMIDMKVVNKMSGPLRQLGIQYNLKIMESVDHFNKAEVCKKDAEAILYAIEILSPGNGDTNNG